MLPEINLSECTYIAAFLSLRCNYHCSYCINRHGLFKPRMEMHSESWLDGLNRLQVERSRMVPITIQGGEPSMHKEWLDILQGIDERFYIDILTNLTFNLDDFICAVPPKRFYRDVPYAPIRVSYHPEQADFDDVLKRAHKLWRHGYDIGIFTVDHPDIDIPPLRKKAEKMGLDFRSKEFLGWHQGKLYGQYKYPESVNGTPIGKTVKCKTTELLIAPDGRIHRCHRDLYAGENPIGHILDKDFQMDFKFRKCDRIGECSCCDLKIKNNRFQQMGACSVEVMDG